MAAAHSSGLSYGKYRAFLELQSVAPDITPEQVQDMTMREIRDLTAALSDGEITDGTGNGTAHSGSGNENSREHKNRENGEGSTNNRGRRKHGATVNSKSYGAAETAAPFCISIFVCILYRYFIPYPQLILRQFWEAFSIASDTSQGNTAYRLKRVKRVLP